MISEDMIADMRARVTPSKAELYRDLSIGLQHAYNDLHEHKCSLYSQASYIASQREEADEDRIQFILNEIATLMRSLLRTEDPHLIKQLDENPCILLQYKFDVFRKN